MKKTIIKDIEVRIDPPSYAFSWHRDPERRAQALQSWVDDLNNFIRDHRSQDANSIYVEKIMGDVCSFCGSDWEVGDDGCPVCCGKAVAEWDETQKNINIALGIK